MVKFSFWSYDMHLDNFQKTIMSAIHNCWKAKLEIALNKLVITFQD